MSISKPFYFFKITSEFSPARLQKKTFPVKHCNECLSYFYVNVMDFVPFDGSQCTISNMPEAPDSNECARPSQNTSQR